MDFVLNLFEQSVRQVLLSVVHNWPFLLGSILIAALLQVFVDARKVSAFLGRHRGAGVIAATAAAVATPLCSCGTTAVILGMMASTMPWAPIVAFMVASPLSSPEGIVYSAGLFGWPFATASFVSSILLGLAGGAVAALLERRGWLSNQARMSAASAPARAAPTASRAPAAARALAQAAPAGTCGCSQPVPMRSGAVAFAHVSTLQLAGACACGDESAKVAACACGSPDVAAPNKHRQTISRLGRSVYTVGARLLPMFLGFAFIGYLLNGLIPAAWVSALFGSGHVYSVPLAATLGLPLYLNSEASLPMVRALMDSGMSQGAVMAFLIAGSGTSMGAIAGALTIARWRVVAVVVAVLWIGAMLAGFGYDLFLGLGG